MSERKWQINKQSNHWTGLVFNRRGLALGDVVREQVAIKKRKDGGIEMSWNLIWNNNMMTLCVLNRVNKLGALFPCHWSAGMTLC